MPTLAREGPDSVDAVTAVAFAVALVPAVILHEIAHGWVALAMGDATARDAGRLSLNPIRHVDPFGTIVLPGALILMSLAGVGPGFVFGYAKPVPVRAERFRDPPRQMMLVAAAGPLMNVLLGGIGALALRTAVQAEAFTVATFALVWVALNVVLAVINLLPIPPLDGSSVVAGVLPAGVRRAYLSVGRYGFLLLIFLLVAFPGFITRIVTPVLEGVRSLLFG